MRTVGLTARMRGGECFDLGARRVDAREDRKFCGDVHLEAPRVVELRDERAVCDRRVIPDREAIRFALAGERLVGRQPAPDVRDAPRVAVDVELLEALR